MIRFAHVPLPADIHLIQQEVLKLATQWKPHHNTYHYVGDWNVVSLRSPGGSAQNIIADITHVGQEYTDTPLMESCPAIHSFVASLQCSVMSVRLLNLKSGALIKPHRDHELCFESGEARLHIPVFTNDKVCFYCEQDIIPMQEGQCWYINANLTHSVENNGPSDRIHLVIDCVVNDWIKELFARAQKSEGIDNSRIENTLATIAALRTHRSAQTDALANALEAQLKSLS
ncbi:Aspartyl/Asparaginyl beta-hydroxylase [Filimonas lacunae]|uniref:Aspartyl/Asparaginyl beta-hydroxylase n=1 Tax=Filimonas lacunae TaxID=477680 RepID=A0A173M9V5_9BACT|nr:aspartyl/asparaginyl beta-hydroxylase domain-containing protein [Filimonas lacunae]BAV04323.1 aspartyl/asparaginyl beta-hydroxylase and related dioxygenases [Filimonas lacunae]SIT31023.1 Aspartyl/Asparaginyl beta-hydroxylase [Filimonas lacunae]